MNTYFIHNHVCDADIILGQGAFGKVMRADAVGILEAEETTQVAVKMVKGKMMDCYTYHKLLPRYSFSDYAKLN